MNAGTSKRMALVADAAHVVDLGLDLRDLAIVVLMARRCNLRPGELFSQIVSQARDQGHMSLQVHDHAHARAVIARHSANTAACAGCTCKIDQPTCILITAVDCPVHGKRAKR